MSDDLVARTSCDCCAGQKDLTPAPLENLPGLDALAYRVGTHAAFKAAMLRSLSRQPALQGLTTREDHDPAIALVDAWASVLDVLSFYQERIANEGFLRTARERYSVREMARVIGYELKPGVAADASLAFSLDDTPDSPGKVTIDAGTRVQSVPGPGEKPQTFETVEKIEARVEWNAIRPKTTKPLPPTTVVLGQTELYLKGVNLQLQPGDAILVVGDERSIRDLNSERWDIRFLDSVSPDPERGITRVAWKEPLGYRQKDKTVLPAAENVSVFVFRQRAALFGNNAPDWNAMSGQPVQEQYPKGKSAGAATDREWPSPWFNIQTVQKSQIDLDASYPKILPDSWLALLRPGTRDMYTELYRVKGLTFESRAEFAISGKTTRVQLDTNNNLANFGLRETMVLAQSELLELAEAPATDDIHGNAIPLDRPVDGLAPGRNLIVSGKTVPEGTWSSELVTFQATVSDGSSITLMLQNSLERRYSPQSVTIYANVARATHGETRLEVLGSGDASRANQRFTLKQTPLTYIQAPTPSGGASTLRLMVDNITWSEEPSLYGLPARKRAYVLRMAEDGMVSVQVGDGKSGERLPTGIENVTASYRVGTGLAGQVKAGQLRLLATRPLGVKAVINPMDASGGEDPETIESARRNAPRTVLTLDRIVSLRDYEDFASGFSGIAKAQAAQVWMGDRRVVHITVAGVRGKPVADLHYLRRAIDAARDLVQPVKVSSIRRDGLLLFNVAADFWVLPGYQKGEVKKAILTALEMAFSVEPRSFGEEIAKGQILAAIQAVEGVKWVKLEALYLDGGPAQIADELTAGKAAWDGTRIIPAKILAVNSGPGGITLTAMEEAQ
jgi:predicted phage baseplate assembly protein